MKKIAVLGAGAWGTAVAKVICDSGKEVALWCRNSLEADRMVRERENKRYLPSIELPQRLDITSNFESMIRNAVLILLAVPASAMRETLRRALSFAPDAGFVVLSKGFEHGSMMLADQIFAEEETRAANCLGVLSGPGFAKEIASGLPAALTLASDNRLFGESVVELIHSNRMRLYMSSDVRGVLVGGAIKNVVAIAAGIADALKLGQSARAALITRGLSEMSRYGRFYGGQSKTFQGLSGIGDLTLTCTSDLSRNRTLGMALGQGKKLEEVVQSLGHVAEGVSSARELGRIADINNIELPITKAVLSILEGRVRPPEAVKQLLDRSPKEED